MKTEEDVTKACSDAKGNADKFTEVGIELIELREFNIQTIY